jgi:hypothetical protein
MSPCFAFNEEVMSGFEGVKSLSRRTYDEHSRVASIGDGVGKNIAPLQKKGMIPYEVLNAGQLKKYLNADW